MADCNGSGGSGSSGSSGTSSSTAAFTDWLRDNGGDESLISFLLDRGFTSKLSLQYLGVESQETRTELLSSLSLGQRCLLIGLISGLCHPESSNSSISNISPSAIGQAQALASHSQQNGKDSIKSKINKLFNFNSGSGKGGGRGAQKDKKRSRVSHSPSSDSDSSDFLPSVTCRSQFRPLQSRPFQGKGKGRLGCGGNDKRKGVGVKRKIKEIRFRIVWVHPGTTNTPRDRGSRTKEVWIRSDASAENVQNCIREEMGWQQTQQFEYMYARGKSLRVAKLADIENSVEWDCDTLKALMGGGCLYVAKWATPAPSPDTDICNSEDEDKVIVIVTN